MKGLLVILFFLIHSLVTGQSKTDPIEQKPDSLQYQLISKGDSIAYLLKKADSIRNDFNADADDLKKEFRNAVSKINIAAEKLNYTMDSLQDLDLPVDSYNGKLDSLNQVRQNTEAKFTSRLDALKAKTTGKLNALDLPPQYKEPLQKLTKNVDGLNIHSDVMQIPSLDIPGYALPKIEGIGDLASKAGEIGKIGDLGNLPEIETPVGDISRVTEQAKGYQEDLKNITHGNLNDVKALPETIEEQAAKLDGVQELQKQSGVIDEYKAKLEDLKDPDAAKEKAVEVVKQAAIDHFAGKQEQLKAAMEKIAKYKQKYSSVFSIIDLPRRPPNAMKGKPFIERLVPGIFFQYQQKNYNLFDLNPYLGYRLSGRFTTGAGWNQRFAYNLKKHQWSDLARIFGPRVYVDFKLGKGFIAHLETEVMNTFVPSALLGNPEVGHREWVWGMMTGMKKEYKIYKNLRGTVLLQYNIFNPRYKAPYVDRLNSRIGFEYQLKKKKK